MNANDKRIRLFGLDDDGKPINAVIREYQEAVSQVQWVKSCFSRDETYILGGAHDYKHRIYIWEKDGGNLVKILEPPKPLDGVIDIAVSFFSFNYNKKIK